MLADAKVLSQHSWKLMVVDEGHRLKNYNCKLLRELRTLSVDSKVLLTGELMAALSSRLISSLQAALAMGVHKSPSLCMCHDASVPACGLRSCVSGLYLHRPSQICADGNSAVRDVGPVCKAVLLQEIPVRATLFAHESNDPSQTITIMCMLPSM